MSPSVSQSSNPSSASQAPAAKTAEPCPEMQRLVNALAQNMVFHNKVEPRSRLPSRLCSAGEC